MSIPGVVSGGKNQNRTSGTQRGTGNQEQQQRLDPMSQAFVNHMRKQAAGSQKMIQGAPGSFIAGPTDAFRQGMGTMGRIAGLDPNIQAQQIGATQVGAPGNVSGGNIGARDFRFNPNQVDTERIQDFQDPFEAQVVRGLQQDFQRQREAGLTAAQQQATAGGAFGGSRGEILQAQALRDVNQAEAQQLAQVRSGGFSQALGATMDEHQLMQNLGLGAAQGRLQAQTAGADLNVRAGMANQQAALQAGLANQQAGLTAAQANQQAGLQAHGLNFQGLGLALQGGGQLTQAGELQRQIQQEQLQEPIMRAQMGQQFLQGGLGPVGMDTTSQEAFNRFMQQQQRGTNFGMSLGFGGATP